MFTFIYDYNCAKIIAIDNDSTELYSQYYHIFMAHRVERLLVDSVTLNSTS